MIGNKILFTTPDLELEGVPLIDFDISPKAKEPHMYTKDDVRKAIEMANDESFANTEDGITVYLDERTKDKIIEQLSQNKEIKAVEIETEILHIHTDPTYYYDIEKIKTQTINGKEYCTITKIYYK